MSPMLKTIFVATLCLSNVTNLALASEDGAQVTFFDVGNDICALAETPSVSVIFTDTLDPKGLCFKSLTALEGQLSNPLLVNLSGHTGNSEAWDKAFSLSRVVDMKSVTERKVEEELMLFGNTRLLILPLAKLHDRGAGFISKLSFAHLSLLFASNNASDGASDINADCAQSGHVYDADTAHDLNSDLMLVPNSGGTPLLSHCFLETVSPHFAVFSAGSGRDQPTTGVANHYLQLGLQRYNMLRTDRGDDESGNEWKDGLTVTGCIDRPGDDTIIASLTSSGSLDVVYAMPELACQGPSDG
ncbi:hypothetical protein [Kordiimonas aquimaris]|uniref:hypothetical protein n=1 Tax=Kordiimonas aquimaris TaxID=707591 RepID=UPI0021D1112F|nr:hypothetical protein [Kordiimonas aquimaris]